MDEIINTEVLGEKIVEVLKTIYDPEIPVDIYELGLIYDVFVNEDRDVKILMTLTSPNCPVAESLPMEVKEKVQRNYFRSPLESRYDERGGETRIRIFVN